ncbi:protein of unknown function [Shinella sp. WSC3-e]|nr:protein of unknown function [Shinella sp. WSC3-e]
MWPAYSSGPETQKVPLHPQRTEGHGLDWLRLLPFNAAPLCSLDALKDLAHDLDVAGLHRFEGH